MTFKFTWHVALIILLILGGVYYYRLAEHPVVVTPGAPVYPRRGYRKYAYIMWGIALAIGLYCLLVDGSDDSSRNLVSFMRGNMCSACTVRHF